MTGLLRRRVFPCRHGLRNSEYRTMEKDDTSIQVAFILHKRRISTQNTLLQIPRVCLFYVHVDCRAYEIEKHWGKTAPPPEQLEYLSAKGGGIMTRPDTWKHPDLLKSRYHSPASTGPGPLSAARGTLNIF